MNRKRSAAVGAASVAAMVMGLLVGTRAVAPTVQGQADIVVTGEAYAVERATDAKRNRSIVPYTISASEIGAIPEFGLGEALQRVPGEPLVINNRRGEAQFLTLRGLPDYNSATLDTCTRWIAASPASRSSASTSCTAARQRIRASPSALASFTANSSRTTITPSTG